MLQIRELAKSYGTQTLFEDASLQMESGERLGLVGRNGHGKTTLFRILLGEEHPDSGTITFPKNYRVGHLEQHLHFTEPTIVAEGCLGLQPGEEAYQYKVETILFGLGFTRADMERAPSEFSGGYQIRLNLAKVLVSEPNLLLLDEPTNYLDIVSMRWLTEFLRSWPGEMILISHDRDFLDSVTTHTASIHRLRIRKVRGPTTKLYEQILLEEEIHEKTRVNDEKKRAQVQIFIDRFRAKANKASVVQSRVKQLERLPQLERLSNIESLDFSFTHAPFEAKVAITVENVTFGYDGGPELIRDFSLNVGSHDRIGIIGKNGKGKSTLLGLIAGELMPRDGSIKMHPNARLGYFGQTNINRLNMKHTVEEEIENTNHLLDRTRVRGICGLMMFDGDKAEKKISALSGGERSRVLLGKILATPSNVLLLDEPTNHLDMESIEALVESLKVFPGAVIIVTHSEMILRAVATKLVVFQGSAPEIFPGTYDEFMDRIGWQDEEGSSGRGGAKKKNVNRKEERQRRAEIIAERSRVLGPLKKNQTQLEDEITALEESSLVLHKNLQLASEEGDAQKIAALSRNTGVTQKHIDELFERLAVVTTELDEKSKAFEAALEEE